MNTPDNDAGKMTEAFMQKISQHIKCGDKPNEAYHYNRVYEAVYEQIRGLLKRAQI